MCVCARARASYFSSVVVLIDFLFYCNFNKNTGCEVHSFLVYIHMFIKYFSTKQNLSFSCAFLLISPEYIFTGAAGCFCQYFCRELFSISLLMLHKLLRWLLYKIARIPMVMVKTFKFNMLYGIFMALYYVLISIWISTWQVCWEIPCVEAFYYFMRWGLVYKILHSKSPSYLLKLIPENKNPYALWSALNNKIPFFNVKTNFLRNSFFSAVITEWNNLDINIHSSSSCNIFKNLLLKFIRLE